MSGDRADAGDRHQKAAIGALACGGDEPCSEAGHLRTNAAPGVQQRQNDGSEFRPIGEKVSAIPLEFASLARGNDQAERLHDAADLV